MFRRIEGEDPLSLGRQATLAPRDSEPVLPVVAPLENERELLPHDHPKWVTDGISISQRARMLVANLKPVMVRALTFWDHRVRSIAIAGRRLQIDPSGSYRIE